MTAANIAPPTQLPDPNLVKLAEGAIAEFEQSILPGIWPAIDKSQLITDMRARLQDPFQVNQGSQPFCGPASLLFELIRHNPPKYVEICRNLYQVGGFHTKSKWITPSRSLREDTGNPDMPLADWMILSTLRESDNLICPVRSNAPEMLRNISGMTNPWEMEGWVKEVLGYRNAQFITAFLTGDLQILHQVSDILQSGGVAFALITAEGLLMNQPPSVPFPSHWISLLGNISTENPDHISFDIFTWAQQMHIDVAEKPLKSYFWGVVAGKP